MMIARRDDRLKRKWPRVFFLDAARFGQLRPQWWVGVVGINELGVRQMPDELLDDAIPLWREYMIPGAKLPAGYEKCQSIWNHFIEGQLVKYKEHGVPYPGPKNMADLSVEFEEKSEDEAAKDIFMVTADPNGDGVIVDSRSEAARAMMDILDTDDQIDINLHLIATGRA